MVVLEAEIAGYGASGRNGAWCVAGVGMTAGELARRHGAGAARRVVTELRDTVDEVGRAAAEEGIDAGFARTGVLRVARGRHEVPGARAPWSPGTGWSRPRGWRCWTATSWRRACASAAASWRCSTRTAPSCIRAAWSAGSPARSRPAAR